MEIVAILLGVIFQLVVHSYTDELVGVTIIVNHGDTIPSKFYPTDPYQNPSYWQNSLGQLSILGKQQSYAVGQWLLKRYISKTPFVSLHYNASQVNCFSEDRDESLMSAECIMAGFLPPVGDEIWNKKIYWRPTPVHNVPIFIDNYIGRGMYCPRYEEDLNKILHGRFFRTHNKEDKSLLEYLTEHTGEKFTNIGQIPELYNILTVETDHNLSLPIWAHEVYPNTLAKVVLEDSILRTKNPEISKLSIGPLMNVILQQLNDIVTNSPAVGDISGHIRKFTMYVGNDTLLYDTLHALKVPPVGVIPFSASIVFELWEDSNGHHYVKLLYKKLQTPIEKLKMGVCKSFKCHYATFNKTLSNLAINFTDWRQLCNQTISANNIDLRFNNNSVTK